MDANPIEALAEDIIDRARISADLIAESRLPAQTINSLVRQDVAAAIATLLVDLLPEGSEAPEAAARLLKD